MGLRIPSAWNAGPPLAKDFLLKKRKGSFGAQVHGPFSQKTLEARDALESGAYFEEFISGRSAKAWCFNGRVAALELIERPYISGDGLRSLQKLAGERGNVQSALPLDKASAMLAWQGMTAASVPAAAQKVWLDFRYATPFAPPSHTNRNVWGKQSHQLKYQFSRATSLLHTSLPADLRNGALFTLDAVVDPEGRVWFLEMNSHPMVHPDVYESMLTALIESAD